MAKTKEVVMVAATDLIEDTSVYPRHAIDDQHVGNLLHALEAGDKLPPIVAARKTKQIVDGFHRRRAWMRRAGDEVAMVPVIWRDYDGDAALFLDAVKLNSTHGRKLDRQDQIRVTRFGMRLKIPTAEMAIALHVTAERVEHLSLRVVFVEGQHDPIPIKPVARHEQGERITADQAQAMRSFSGYSLGQQVTQVHSAVKAGLYDHADQVMLTRLHDLATLIVAEVPTTAEAGAEVG